MKDEKIKLKKVEFDDKMWKLWGIPIFGGDKAGLLKRTVRIMKDKKLVWMVTINPEHVMATFAKATAAKKSGRSDYFRLLQESDLNVADGIGLIWAKYTGADAGSRPFRWWRGLTVGLNVLQGKYENEVIAGSGLMTEMAEVAAANNWKIFYLGGFGDRAKRTAAYFEKQEKGLAVDWSAGEPQVTNGEVLKKVSESRPEILFVAYGMKKQEEWIQKNRMELEKAGVRLVMGVGRSFDYYSGDLKRAPKFWRKMGLEWLYSLIQEPKRWRRQLELPKFIWRITMGK